MLVRMLRALLGLVVLWLTACTDEPAGTFGPPDEPQKVRLAVAPSAPAPPSAPARAPAIDAGSAAPAPAARQEPQWREPSTREEVLELFAKARNDPECSTGDPWVNFVGRKHSSELLTLLAAWALDATANDRRVALAALSRQSSTSLTPMWKQLAAEEGTPFAHSVVWGLLRCGGDAEVPLALQVLAKVDDPDLVHVAKASRPGLSAKKLSSRISLMQQLQPGREFGRLGSLLPARETWSALVRAEPAAVACMQRRTKRPDNEVPEVQVRLVVDALGKVVSADATAWNEQDDAQRSCVERIAQKLKLPPATPGGLGKERTSQVVFRVTSAGLE